MKKKKTVIVMDESAKKKFLRKAMVYSCVLAMFAVAMGFLCLALNNFYENKNHKWDIPPIKVAFPESDQNQSFLGDIIDKFKNNSDVHKGLGVINVVQGENDKAIAHYDSAIAAEPDNAALYLQRGSAYLMKGNLEEGVRDMETASRLNPKYEPLYRSAMLLRSKMQNAGVKSLNEVDINKMGRALRSEDAEKYAKSMGMNIDDKIREALKAKAQGNQ